MDPKSKQRKKNRNRNTRPLSFTTTREKSISEQGTECQWRTIRSGRKFQKQRKKIAHQQQRAEDKTERKNQKKTAWQQTGEADKTGGTGKPDATHRRRNNKREKDSTTTDKECITRRGLKIKEKYVRKKMETSKSNNITATPTRKNNNKFGWLSNQKQGKGKKSKTNKN